MRFDLTTGKLIQNSVATIGDSGDVTFTLATSGSNNSFTYSNANNVANTGVQCILGVGGALAGDPWYRYNIAGVIDWSHGVDNSTADSWKLSKSSTLGSNDYLICTVNGEITMPLQPSFVASINNPTNVTGDATAYTVAYNTTTVNRGSGFNYGNFYLHCSCGWSLSILRSFRIYINYFYTNFWNFSFSNHFK